MCRWGGGGWLPCVWGVAQSAPSSTPPPPFHSTHPTPPHPPQTHTHTHTHACTHAQRGTMRHNAPQGAPVHRWFQTCSPPFRPAPQMVTLAHITGTTATSSLRAASSASDACLPGPDARPPGPMALLGGSSPWARGPAQLGARIRSAAKWGPWGTRSAAQWGPAALLGWGLLQPHMLRSLPAGGHGSAWATPHASPMLRPALQVPGRAICGRSTASGSP
jgi:hypothetical protein